MTLFDMVCPDKALRLEGWPSIDVALYSFDAFLRRTLWEAFQARLWSEKEEKANPPGARP